tara:strand:- start:49 stop:372 length:324 start_codon:yes stop_codon:yes gene_type:complete
MTRTYKPLPEVKYRPLPENLTIKQSNIEGLGLFAKVKIIKNTVLGVSHVKSEDAEDGFLRTPLGGFINHSNNPNCIKKENSHNLYLKTVKDIEEGEELTLKYTIYKL